MSNLSDLLPAGASAKQLTFTDSGSGIASKKPVILNSDGTVTEVGETSNSIGIGSATNYNGGTSKGYYNSIAYDTVNDKILLAYNDSDTGYGMGVVGTVSGTSLSWGTPVAFESAGSTWIHAAFDTSAEKFLIVWKDTSSYGQGIVGTISGTSVSYAGKARVDGSGSTNGYGGLAYDTNAAASVYVYYRSGYAAQATVNTISGTTITSGTPVGFGASGDVPLDITYDSTAQKIVCCYQGSSNYIRNIVGTVSGTSISFGSELNTGLATNGNGSVSYDPVQDKTLFYFNETSGSHNGYLAVMTVSGTGLSIGSYVTNSGASEGYVIARYNAASASHVIAWSTGSAGKARDVTISGTTPTLNATTTDWSSDYLDYIGMGYDPDQKVMVIACGNDVVPKAYSIVYRSAYTATNLTAQAFVGVADSAISASAAGSVIVQGGTVGGITLGTGPSAGANATYAPTPDDPYRYSMCYDTANDKVVIAYNDEANNYYLYACVGTVTGNAISWGTVVAVDETGTMDQIQLTYDTNADRVLLVFRDQSTGGDLSGRVGTVSGTTISFGSKTTGTPHPGGLTSIYDPTEQKHLLTYHDNNNSNYGYSCVATVTGGATNTVAFGTQVQFSSDSNLAQENYPMCYYTSENTIVMLYDIYFTGRYAVACTISGTSVSFGTPVVSYAWGTYGQLATTGITYDSTANKAVEIAALSASPHILYSSVISLSGTTVTWGTPVTASATSAGDTFRHAASIAYSSAGNNFLIAYSDDSNSSYLYGVSGTLSGTSTTWGTPVVLRSVSVASDQETDLIYDPDSQNFVVAYRTATPAGESNVVSVGDLPLTTGTKYYVTTTGGFSSSAGDPSVNAGLAISTTSLLLNGDS